MAHLQIRWDAFKAIEQAAMDAEAAYDPNDYEKFVDDEIETTRRSHPSLNDITADDYFHWTTALTREETQIELARSPPTPEEFFGAAYKHNPLLNPGVRTELNMICTKLRSPCVWRNLEAIPFGRLYGHKYSIIPGRDPLPSTEDKPTELPYAITDSLAIAYPVDHSSEDGTTMPSLEDLLLADHQVLHRLWPLGWVIRIEPNRNWFHTGHILVMDMEEGRDHHPWFVLASEWPSMFEDAEGSFTTYADDHNNSNQSKLAADDDRPVLERFGANCDFEIDRFGENETIIDRMVKNYGPEVQHVMDWYWDPKGGEEVCFYKGAEWLRYDRETGEVYRPSNKKL